ncbi:cytochrome P450 [Aspergillus fijiensis CBS 313.89]|uniref:Cytochrome P450 n=1 Tax=Aspergillus fijiensis CBS 313.89 TaxID=1448319 RepID=A0A8G1VWL6_9EURO|nr:cytochrome P450 [Aspergillus fijiensis CBS 313.89]RAK74326.1 cytochrome P450 [Aspergillus fijiensis CBS 313.89]
MSILTILCLALVLSASYTLARIYTTYRPLRDSPLPVLIVATSLPHPLRSLFTLVDHNSRLALFFQRDRFSHHSWNFRDKFALHARYGRSFFLVTPGGREFITADRPVADQILVRRRAFPKPLGLLDKLELFGPHLASVEDTTWQCHRRITASAFTASTDQAVWTVSLARAAQLVATTQNGTTTATSTSTFPDLADASLDVLLHVCLPTTTPSDTTFNPQECKSALLRFLGILTAPTGWSLLPWRRSQGSRGLWAGARELGESIAQLVEYRRHRLDGTLKRGHGDLLSTLLRCEGWAGSGNGSRDYLSPDEIRGNVFLFLFAGHETTANTLLYAVYLLAIFPGWQDWVGQEMDFLLKGVGGDEEPGFEVLEGLRRLRAVLMETLRLFGPVVNVLRETREQDQMVKAETPFVIPENTSIRVNSVALHTDPGAWGCDAAEWRPSRWVVGSSTGQPGEDVYDAEMEQKLIAWSEGPRVCPGKRFSQIEVLAVLLQLFRRHRVEIVAEPGETVEEARERAYARVQQSTMSLTLHIPQPEKTKPAD